MRRHVSAAMATSISAGSASTAAMVAVGAASSTTAGRWAARLAIWLARIQMSSRVQGVAGRYSIFCTGCQASDGVCPPTHTEHQLPHNETAHR